MQPIDKISAEKPTPFTGKKLVIKRILDVIKKEQPIRPDILKAKITTCDPYLSDKRAKEFILNLALSGQIDYIKKGDGEEVICLSKNS